MGYMTTGFKGSSPRMGLPQHLSNYVATVTTDANGNITEIGEVRNVLGTPTTVSTNTFEYDPPRPGQRCLRRALAGTSLNYVQDFPGRAMSIGMNADAPVFISINSGISTTITHESHNCNFSSKAAVQAAQVISC